MFKEVCQLDENGYFIGTTLAQESPLEPGVLLLPPDCIDSDVPLIKEGYVIRYDHGWVYEKVEPVPVNMQQPDESEVTPFEPIMVELKGNKFPAYLFDIMAYKLFLEMDINQFEIKNLEGSLITLSREELKALVAQAIVDYYESQK